MHDLTSTAGVVAVAAGAVAVAAFGLSAGLAVTLRRVRIEQRAVLGDLRVDLVGHAVAVQSQSGIVLSSIHHRDQARMYAKQVRQGRAELKLSPEAHEAIRLALEGEAAHGEPS